MYVSHRPVTRLGYQEGRRVFWEGPKFFELFAVVLNYVQHIFLGGFAPPSSPLVTVLVSHIFLTEHCTVSSPQFWSWVRKLRGTYEHFWFSLLRVSECNCFKMRCHDQTAPKHAVCKVRLVWCLRTLLRFICHQKRFSNYSSKILSLVFSFRRLCVVQNKLSFVSSQT